MQFSKTYLDLGEAFFKSSEPKRFHAPELVLFNDGVAEELEFENTLRDNHQELALLLSGQKYFGDHLPAALAYSGHQFGQFNPSLGDGRAHYLTEIMTKNKTRMELQLKGSGPTPFSRGGDGLCALGPAVREYIMSAAMVGLRVPTTRSLSVVTTGEKVFRNTVTDGAVVSRVARSHVRVGTFQYFVYRGDVTSLRKLADYCLAHYVGSDYGGLDFDSAADHEKYSLLLRWVIDQQVCLIVEWMRVGFIHGVMNTDNSSIVGDTIDFGPCAMLGVYNPDTVYSSIDQHGRYSFGNQSKIGLWNLTRFAECLIPLINHKDPEKAVEVLEPELGRYSALFSEHYDEMMQAKLGFAKKSETASTLVDEWLSLLKKHHLDYTNSFSDLVVRLKDGEVASTEYPQEVSEFLDRWQTALDNTSSRSKSIALMERQNPFIVPRNHLVEQAIQDCVENNDFSTAKDLTNALENPYERSETKQQFTLPPDDADANYVTFCGT